MDRVLDLEAERVCGCYRRLLLTVVRSILGPVGTAEDAEDCVQEVLWEYLKQRDKLDGRRGSEKTYLCVLARSRARTLRGRLAAQAGVPLEEELALAAPDGRGEAEMRQALGAAVGALTAEERKLFTLRFVYQWSVRETAKELGVSQSAVTTRTGRLREKLGRLLAEEGVELCGKE